MSDQFPPDQDPFSADDPDADAREARRRAREERRRRRGEGSRKSLADRVSGALHGGGDSEPPAEEVEGPEPVASPSEPKSPQPEAPVEPLEQATSPSVEPREPEPRFSADPFGPEPDSQPESEWSDPDPEPEPEPEAEWGDPEPARPDPDPMPPIPPAREPRRSVTQEFDAPLDFEPDEEPDAEPEDGDGGFDTGEVGYAYTEPGYTDEHSYEEDARGEWGRSSKPAAAALAGLTGVLADPIWRKRLVLAAAIGTALLVFIALLSQIGGSDPEPVAVAPVEPVETVSVSIPEGLTLDGMAGVAKKAGLKGSYKKAAAKAAKKFPLSKYGAEEAPSLEGFLFPATYEVEKKAPAGDLVQKQLDAFEQNFGGINLRAAKKKNLTPYDVVNIASMIEREVSVADERPLVSAVIYNRLAAGEPLGIDATLRYELDNFTEPLLESELAADTPYNSRTRLGLPPTPIGNPGLASLEAAANPAKSDAFFYVIEPGTCNEHTFTEDAAEFEAAVAEYQAALAEEGGSPTKC